MTSNRLAPEWERQDAIIIVWPHLHSDWTTSLDAIEITYLELCRHICRTQRLLLVAYDQAHQRHIEQTLNKAGIKLQNVLFIIIPTNDTWVRDYGPICVNSGKPSLLDFTFDAWGQKYDHDLDHAFNTKLTKQLDLNVHYQQTHKVLEAGNIEINSLGEMLCTNTCFKRKTSDPSNDFATLEEQFEHWFGCSKTYWIDAVKLIGDDTDGHIDTLARFCTNDEIVYTSAGNPSDANNETLHHLETQLLSIKKQSNNRIDLIPLPLPNPIFSSNAQLPTTYTNFLITNESVLVPTFSDKQDNYALKLFEEIFPTREIVAIESSTLTQQFGGIHCATMQIPKGILK